MESRYKAYSKYRLGKITNKYLLLEIIFFAFYRFKGFKYLQQVDKKLKQLLSENLKAALFMSKDPYHDIKDLPCTSSKINLPRADFVNFVLINEDRLYGGSDSILFIYSLSDLTSPIAMIRIQRIYSCIIIDKSLYLGG